ncbi:acetoin reductase family protein [Peniophora sp. CONT]|nr:acetoin reductase family protein [Peniophora sp. CONT]
MASLKVASHRVAIVTGAARGIGRSIALRLGRDGHDVAVADMRGSAVYEVEREIRALGRRSMALYTDVSKEDEVKKLVDDVASKLGSVDIMVANAGVWKAGSVLEARLEDYENVMSVNARGVFLCYKHAGLKMVEQGRGGRIIGASSISGKVGGRHWLAYTASKFAVRGITQAAALELAQHNITVNSYAPGAVDSQMAHDVFEESKKENAHSQRLAASPMGRIGTTDEIASYVSWLTSEGAGFVTGQTTSIDGGVHFD